MLLMVRCVAFQWKLLEDNSRYWRLLPNLASRCRPGSLATSRAHAGGSFNAASFTLTGGTGLVDFSAGTGLMTTGDISIATNGNILGTYTGTNGILDAGAGSITATVSFGTLDISGAGATLSAGYIGAPGAVTQTMANLISIDGQRYPWPAGIPNDSFTFASLYIGGSEPHSGGPEGDGGTSPVLPPDPGPEPGPAPPPGPEPSGRPVTPAPEIAFDSLMFDIARIQRSTEMILPVELATKPQCDAASAYASCDAVPHSR